MLNRVASINQAEMGKAFARAGRGLPTLVGLASHDFRDLGTEVEHITELVYRSAEKFPGVKFRYCTSLEGFRRAIGVDETMPALDLDLILDRAPKDDVPNLTVTTNAGRVFGPQPFLAIETRSRRFIHDNFDFSTTGDQWFYAFHDDTLPLEDVRRIGIAANDAAGNTFVDVIDL